MLIGDRGRVVPFRHFKTLAVGICGGFILMLIAFIVILILYTNQMKTVADLRSEITRIKLQNSKLKDEKELYLTKLMLFKNQSKEKAEKPVSKPIEKTPETPVQIKAEPKPAASKPKKEPPAEKQPPKIEWMADIRNFSASYDAGQKSLNAKFRIFNKSKPKKRLSGRSLVVFKDSGEPSAKWLPVPQVQLKDGKPAGSKGQPFEIRNYLTMRFRSYDRKAPIHYDTVTAYVFSNEGKLLASKDFAVNIDVPEPEKKKPVVPMPAVEKKNQHPAQDLTEGGAKKPQDDMTASPAPEQTDKDPAQTQTAIEREEAPAGKTPGDPVDRSTGTSIPANNPASGDQESPSPVTEPPGTAPKSKIEGEQQ